MLQVQPQLLVFSYHKTGTSLSLHVMTKVGARLGLNVVNQYGLVDHLESLPDIILLPHSQVRASFNRPYRAVRLIRDPRDIWTSGYLYHLHCTEPWCLNIDMNPASPIRWPKVDHSVEHWSESWKQNYLKRLGGKSYQQNLIDRSTTDGLDFELAGYTGCTLETIRSWNLNQADVLDVKLEEIVANFDVTMRRMFDHFGFTTSQTEAALQVARSEDVRRMDDAAIAERPQIHSRTISKWRDILSTAQIAHFEQRYGDLITGLGYELSNATAKSSTGNRPLAWSINSQPLLYTPTERIKPNDRWPDKQLPRSASTSSPVDTTQDAAIRLSADGAFIRPSVADYGTCIFIVPAGKALVRLESRRSTGIEMSPDHQGSARCLGLKVSKIVIQSDAGEVAIAADDPSLATGWHDAEHVGTALWRWTGGSAELPWAGVSGPAVVTVHCTTLSEYLIGDEMLPL